MIIKYLHDLIGAFIIGDVNRLFTGSAVENQQDVLPWVFGYLRALCLQEIGDVFWLVSLTQF